MEEGVNNSPNGRPPPPGFNQAYLENNQPVGGAGNIASVGVVGQQPSAARADLWQQTLQAAVAATTQPESRRRMQSRKPLRQTPVERNERSLLCLIVQNPLRRACISITEWRPFEWLILMVGIFKAFLILIPLPKSVLRPG
uniref:Uncharacterized protein n=1 Tax=Meloidogyne javanica TaxID=6303 RepID=A0A915MT82_MELJA